MLKLVTNRYTALGFKSHQGADRQIVRETPDRTITSDRYIHVHTEDVIDIVKQSTGFQVDNHWAQKRSKNGMETDTTKHLVRLTLGGIAEGTHGMGNLVPTINIINSHDRTSSLKIVLGFTRLVCDNGLSVGQDLGSFSVRHSGKRAMADELEKRLLVVAEQFNHILAAFRKMAEIDCTPDMVNQLVDAAGKIKFGDTWASFNEFDRLHIQRQLLQANRTADLGNNLFVVFNRIQENLMLGVGLKRRRPTTSGVAQIEMTQDLLSEALKIAA